MAKNRNNMSEEDESIFDKLSSSFGGMSPKGDPGRKKMHFSFWYFLLALLAFSLIQDYIVARQTDTIPYSKFKGYVAAEKVKNLVLTPQRVTGIITKDGQGRTDWPFVTVRVNDPGLVKLLDAHKIKYTGHYESKWLSTLLSWIIPIGFFFIIWKVLISRVGGGPQGVLSIGKSHARVVADTGVRITFRDVAGIDEAKQELAEIVEFLRTPEKFTRLGGKIPKGVLLVGAPGTGKTLLAKAVAGESGVSFFSMSGSDFVEMFVGVGAARVRDLFAQAKEHAPCIIFVDELDALGKARGINPMGGHDEREQTLNQLLVEMDGFDATVGVIIMAATNRPEILDPALLRPGRFDRHVAIDRPDVRGREEILKVHVREVKLSAEVDLAKVAALTPGFVGADLANLVNEAALLSARRNKGSVGMAEFQDAIDRLVGGLEKKNRMMNENEKRIVAYHESGHALVAMSLPTADPVNKVTIIPRGIAALGYTQQLPTEDRYLMTREELFSRLCVLVGGRVAEEIIFQDISTGAQNDLQKATDIARSMVTEYGMSEKLGLVTFERERRPFMLDMGSVPANEYSEETARDIDAEISQLVEKAHERVRKMLTRGQHQLEIVAQKLLEKETLTGDELRELVGTGFAAGKEDDSIEMRLNRESSVANA
jgi:cell division protease FtsH